MCGVVEGERECQKTTKKEEKKERRKGKNSSERERKSEPSIEIKNGIPLFINGIRPKVPIMIQKNYDTHSLSLSLLSLSLSLLSHSLKKKKEREREKGPASTIGSFSKGDK